MNSTYVQKASLLQKSSASKMASVLDSSSQSESLQRKADMANNAAQRAEAPRPNNTGMPDNLKSGIESLSGFSMDDVRVHYNSSKPATVQALAYTQGTDIHVAPGQEKHLPHEAWHVAQQMAGRVSPTTNINGMPVNDNAALEHEADVMGEKAVQCKMEQFNSLRKIENTNKLNPIQGYFLNGLLQEDMKDRFNVLKSKLLFLQNSENQEEFEEKNESLRNEGSFYQWVMEKRPEALSEGFVKKCLFDNGVSFSTFSDILSHFQPVRPTTVFSDCRAREVRTRERSASPVGRSRIINVPNLVATITDRLNENGYFGNFDFILGGGSAIVVKKLDAGRLGRTSENMRDIDMDFQRKRDSRLDMGLPPDFDKRLLNFLKPILHIPEGANVIIETSVNNTIQYKFGDFEISFHYVDADGHGPLRFDQISNFNVVNDESHWDSIISSLETRRCRPEKIYNSIVDAFILAKGDLKIPGIHRGRVNQFIELMNISPGFGLYKRLFLGILESGIKGLSEEDNLTLQNNISKKIKIRDEEIHSSEKTCYKSYCEVVETVVRDIRSKCLHKPWCDVVEHVCEVWEIK